MSVELHLGDCLDILPTLPAQSVEAIITDLPYGTTACKWDSIIPFAPMWEQVKRVLKPRGVFVTTASQPFTSKLVMSNPDWFKYEWIWKKDKPSNFALANKQPMKYHENIIVFSAGASIYNKQITYNNKPMNGQAKYGRTCHDSTPKIDVLQRYVGGKTTRNPSSIITANTVKHNSKDVGGLHPTQKPVALYEYLIHTYTNEGDTVLDFCAGSGTTGVACVNTGRNAILIEKERPYFEIIQRRIAEAQAQPTLLVTP